MTLSILYCAECAQILAASRGLDLTAECITHQVDDGLHRGFLALLLPDADEAAAGELADLGALAARYPKDEYAAMLEPLAGVCA